MNLQVEVFMSKWSSDEKESNEISQQQEYIVDAKGILWVMTNDKNNNRISEC